MNQILLEIENKKIKLSELLKNENNKKYLNAIEEFQVKENDKPYTDLMLQLLNRTMKVVISMLDIKPTKEDTKLMTISKYAKYKGVPVSTVRYWIEIGKIKPTSYTNSGYMLFDED